MKTLHKIIERPALNDAQLASIWIHLDNEHEADYTPEEAIKVIIYIDKYTGDVSYNIKEVGFCTMDHEQEWAEVNKPFINIDKYNIVFWNSNEESA